MPRLRRPLADNQLSWLAVAAMLLWGLTGFLDQRAGLAPVGIKKAALIAGSVMLVVQVIVNSIKKRRAARTADSPTAVDAAIGSQRNAKAADLDNAGYIRSIVVAELEDLAAPNKRGTITDGDRIVRDLGLTEDDTSAFTKLVAKRLGVSIPVGEWRRVSTVGDAIQLLSQYYER